ncbi:carboxypeptidase-like regulatory domain-containing protein [Candidatus Palauibacter sp.]|uniref:carboxypeptidase-like regulatory domain-containing protein n=1 Tax=Candidatus Palauibacter sp. TaxID=3101350 RepID=UPI003AF1F898
MAHTRAVLMVLLLASAVWAGFEPAAAQEPGRVTGAVQDEGTGEPLEGAAVRLVAADGTVRETVTTPGGAFAFESVSAGSYELSVTRLGYGRLTTSLVVGPDQGANLLLRLQPEAIPLDPLNVEIEGRPARLVESGFYERLEKGWGTFFDPAALARNQAGYTQLSQLVPALENRAPSGCPAHSVPVFLDGRPVEFDGRPVDGPIPPWTPQGSLIEDRGEAASELRPPPSGADAPRRSKYGRIRWGFRLCDVPIGTRVRWPPRSDIVEGTMIEALAASARPSR